jgi:hypothetical protein
MKNGAEQPHSVGLRLFVAKRVQESTAGATVQFHTGQHGRLSRTHRDFEYHLTLAQRSVERHQPVGVSIARTGEIVEMAKAENDIVAFLAEQSGNTVTVGFQGHDGIAHLERQHPRFDEIERNLSRSLKEKRRIWFVWKLPRLTLEDVMIVGAENEEK